MQKWRHLRILVHAASWALLTCSVAVGVLRIPNEIIGGTYSNTDGQWLAWNATFILHYANFLDPSPHNAFAGMGSMYLPNLPWLNPGALLLSLPVPQETAYLLSYLVYMFGLGGSIAVLARSLGFSWMVATIAAQLHILVLFPPFSYFFNPIEWYSAGPMYAHLTTVLNLATALFLRIGRWPPLWSLAGGLFGLSALMVIGLFSAPFSFVFFFPPYVTLGIVVLLVVRPSRHELAWKLVCVLSVSFIRFAIGFPDYLRAMMETSARTPRAPIVWSSLLSPRAWWNLLLHHSICSDPRTLICAANSVNWLQILAVIGSAALVLSGSGIRRAVGIWGAFYTAAVHAYAYLFASGWLGPLAALSNHFLSWASYSILVIPVVVALPMLLEQIQTASTQLNGFHGLPPPAAATGSVNALLRSSRYRLRRPLVLVAVYAAVTWGGIQLFRGTLLDPTPRLVLPSRLATAAFRLWWGGVIIGSFFLVAWRVVRVAESTLRLLSGSLGRLNLRNQCVDVRRFTFSALPLLIIPATSLCLLPTLEAVSQPLRTPTSGPISDRLKLDGELSLGESFRGFAATVWSKAVDAVDPYHRASTIPTFRYIGGRLYFDKYYGNTFTETDLWTKNIPTFEEYGQWVSLQAQIFVLALLADDKVRQSQESVQQSRLLRIYKPDIDLMRALGIRFMITDELIQGDSRLTFLATQSAPGALPVHLYELRNPNLATFSPTEAISTIGSAAAIFANITNNPAALDRKVFVTAPLVGDFVPAEAPGMRLVRDGYRVAAQSTGRSLLLLPIQYSHCLTISDHVGGQSRPRLVRANFIETMVVFDRSLDATIRFQFGLFGNASCRLQDAADISALTLRATY